MVTKQSLLTTWITTEREREPELRLLLSDQRPASKCSVPPPTKLSRSATVGGKGLVSRARRARRGIPHVLKALPRDLENGF